MDELRIWRIDSGTAIITPPPNNLRGPVTADCWLRHQDRNGRLLCFGTALGYVVLWEQYSDHVRDTIDFTDRLD